MAEGLKLASDLARKARRACSAAAGGVQGWGRADQWTRYAGRNAAKCLRFGCLSVLFGDRKVFLRWSVVSHHNIVCHRCFCTKGAGG